MEKRKRTSLRGLALASLAAALVAALRADTPTEAPLDLGRNPW